MSVPQAGLFLFRHTAPHPPFADLCITHHGHDGEQASEGNQAETVEGRSIPLGKDYFDFTTYEPFGVSAQIIPWNYPMQIIGRSVVAALATGNAAVLKPAEEACLTALEFARIAAEA